MIRSNLNLDNPIEIGWSLIFDNWIRSESNVSSYLKSLDSFTTSIIKILEYLVNKKKKKNTLILDS